MKDWFYGFFDRKGAYTFSPQEGKKPAQATFQVSSRQEALDKFEALKLELQERGYDSQFED